MGYPQGRITRTCWQQRVGSYHTPCYPPPMALTPTPAPQAFARSVFAIHITPLKQALSLPGRKIHIALARFAGEQYQRLSRDQRESIESALREYIANLRSGKRATEPPLLLQPQFSAKLADVARAIGYEPKEARHLWPAITALVATSVQFNSLRHSAARTEQDLYPDELEVATTLLSSAVRTGRGELAWAYDPKILSIMVAPRTYAMLNLELVRSARTYTALALYENCRRFVGIGVAGPYPIERWQQLLSPEGNRPAWENVYEFMRRVKRSIKELHTCEGCDIEIEVERVKLPNAGAGLQFKVRPLDQSKLPFGIPLPRNPELMSRLVTIGFSEREAGMMVENHGEEYLLAKFELFDKSNKNGKPIGNPKGWLNAAVARDFQDAEVQQATVRKMAQARELRLQRADQLKAAFQSFQAEQLRSRFYALEEDLRVNWEVQFAAAHEGHLTSSLAGKAKEQAFFGWLAQQAHGLFQEPEEYDLATFAVTYASQYPASSAPSADSPG